MKTVQVKCQSCGDSFTARVSDRERGWGRFCSKSCKAVKQMKTHGDTRKQGGVDDVDDFDPSWDSHKIGGF